MYLDFGSGVIGNDDYINTIIILYLSSTMITTVSTYQYGGRGLISSSHLLLSGDHIFTLTPFTLINSTHERIFLFSALHKQINYIINALYIVRVYPGEVAFYLIDEIIPSIPEGSDDVL